MPHVVALYRYPVKGFTPESCETLTVLDEGRIAGDRVLGLRFGDIAAADDAWSKKTGMVALLNTPGLARLNVNFEQKEIRLRISIAGAVLVDEVLDENGRKRVAAIVADYVLKLNDNPLSAHPERLPLRLVGDGFTARYHDSEAGRVTLHGRGSLQAVAAMFENSAVSELRFRSNIAVDGLDPWEEQTWVGGKVRIGTIDFDVVKPTIRCLATHANPKTGERDLPVLTTLTRVLGQKKPTFAVSMLPSNGGGTIHLGDPVRLIT